MLGCALLLAFESIFLYAVVTKGVVDTETLHYGVNGAWSGISLSNFTMFVHTALDSYRSKS